MTRPSPSTPHVLVPRSVSNFIDKSVQATGKTAIDADEHQTFYLLIDMHHDV